MSDTYFRVYSGLLTPEHQKRIGSALWTFLWMIDHITDEPESNGERSGIVLYGNPVPYTKIGDDLGIGKSTVKRHCETLEKEEYIQMQITPRGNIYRVSKSKKWNNPLEKSADNGTHNKENRAESGTESAKYGTQGANNGTVSAGNEYSNINNSIKRQSKDITTAA